MTTAKLVVGKVLDKDGNGDVSHVMKGIEWILKERKKYGDLYYIQGIPAILQWRCINTDKRWKL